MPDAIPKLAQEFCCPKCHNRHGVAREIVLTKTGLLDFLPSKDNRYIELTCQLCGYTEFYNRAIFLADSQTETARKKAPLPETPEQG